MSDHTGLFDRQTKYALRKYKCSEVVNERGTQINNMVEFVVDRPFIFLHAFVVEKSNDTDRYSDLSQGYQNDLVYLDPHPVVQVAQVAEISSSHIAPNNYYVQDLRPDVGRSNYEQYVFVLLCLNF